MVLTVNGTGFLSSSVVQVNGMSETTTFVSSTELTANVAAAQLAQGAMLSVQVLNAGSTASAPSSAASLEVDNPAPAITQIAPAALVSGSAGTTVTVTGTGFVPTTVLQVAGAARTTTFVSSTQLSFALTSSDVAAAGSLSLTAVNPSPGGGTSAATAIAVNNQVPGITALAPATVIAGATSATTVTVSGTNFLPAITVQVGGANRATTYVSSTQVSFQLTVADQATAGSLVITAVNPSPGGGSSAAASLPVNDPVPSITTLAPATVIAGTTSAATVTLSGTSFLPTTTVQVGGANRATTYVSNTQVSFQLTVADQATAGKLAVTAVNPSPGGGTSASATLTVSTPTPTPVITSVSPTQFFTSTTSSTIGVLGGNLSANSVVQWNGTPLVTTYSSSLNGVGYLSAVIPATLLTAPGTANVTVLNSTANPSTSNSVAVTISNPPAPTLTSLSPNAGPINTATGMTLYGTGFSSGSTVAVNGTQVASTYASPTEITLTLPASSVATPGNVNFTVTTPAPGGGTSSPLIFTAYIAVSNNDIVYNATDGLLYASVPGTAATAGNSVVGIDPTTGNIMRQIWVGSNPNKLALSTDGTQLFVGLDGAGAVAQVNLTQGTVVNHFSLGGSGSELYTATYLAAVPGLPNSVAVTVAGGSPGVTIFDSGVARAQSSSGVGEGPLSFGSSASTLYMAGSSIEQLTVGATGITAATSLASASGSTVTSLQYDNGQLYLSTGVVLNASTGALEGTLYSSGSVAASGPVVSDSTLGTAFVGRHPSQTAARFLRSMKALLPPLAIFR